MHHDGAFEGDHWVIGRQRLGNVGAQTERGRNGGAGHRSEAYCFAVSSPLDWNQLRVAARSASDRSYAPYSKVHVGAAALTTEGAIVVGSNVENASYGLTLCAECSLVSDLIRLGHRRLRALSVVAGDGQYLAPCGRCRQVLFEFGGPELLIDQGDELPARTLDELLPGAFGPTDLETRSNS